MEKLVKDIAKQIESYGAKNPEIAVILGSGLANILDDMQDKIYIPFQKLNGMPLTNVDGHKNQFVFGKIADKNVLAMQGRFHLYDGFSAKEVCLPIYIFKLLGVKTVIITNASGSINQNIKTGDLMIITDHINFTNQNALIGGAIIDFGEQFVDMTEPYSHKLIDLAQKVATQNNINLKNGVYAQVVGPFYETIAQAKMLKICGCDAVGMSTVVEVEAGVQCGLDILGLSIITDMADSQQPTTHKEVLEQSQIASQKLKKVIFGTIEKL